MPLGHDVGVQLARVGEGAAGLEDDGQGEGVPAAPEVAHAAEEAEGVGLREGAEDGVAAEGGWDRGRGKVVVEDGERAKGREGGGCEGKERGGGGGCEGEDAGAEQVRVELDEVARGERRCRGKECSGGGGGGGDGAESARQTLRQCHGTPGGRE